MAVADTVAFAEAMSADSQQRVLQPILTAFPFQQFVNILTRCTIRAAKLTNFFNPPKSASAFTLFFFDNRRRQGGFGNKKLRRQKHRRSSVCAKLNLMMSAGLFHCPGLVCGQNHGTQVGVGAAGANLFHLLCHGCLVAGSLHVADNADG